MTTKAEFECQKLELEVRQLGRPVLFRPVVLFGLIAAVSAIVTLVYDVKQSSIEIASVRLEKERAEWEIKKLEERRDEVDAQLTAAEQRLQQTRDELAAAEQQREAAIASAETSDRRRDESEQIASAKQAELDDLTRQIREAPDPGALTAVQDRLTQPDRENVGALRRDYAAKLEKANGLRAAGRPVPEPLKGQLRDLRRRLPVKELEQVHEEVHWGRR